MRQFHQFGAECFGSYDPAADAEMISLADTVLSELNINGYTININSLGGTACRAKYNEVLKTFLKENLSALCPVCQTRYETNPLRVLDCKDESCKEILVNSPIPLDSLDTECKLHWEKLQSLLDTLDIQYTVNGRIVRGLDYYTRTVFEFIDADTGLTICGGGRYDRLIEECGGAATGAVGFAMGLERIISMMPDALTKRPYVYIGAIGEAGFYKAQSVAQTLRRSGIRAQPDIVGRGVKAQMRFADKTGAIYSFIIGDDEMVNHQVKIKDMRTNSETAVSFNELLNFFS
jgi:histidyl-tRNA synthetase